MTSSPICVDASFVLRAVLPHPSNTVAEGLLAGWVDAGREIVAPDLLYYEAANVLHRYRRLGVVPADVADGCLDVVLGLPVSVHQDPELHRRAAALARELDQSAACDAHYLALAERLSATLWTADARLHRAARTRYPRIQLLSPS